MECYHGQRQHLVTVTVSGLWQLAHLKSGCSCSVKGEARGIFYARFWRYYAEQIAVPYFTIFPPMWPFVNKLLFYRQLVFCHMNVISHMRTMSAEMSAACRLLAGKFFWRMAALSIVLLCRYRKASYAITGVTIVVDVTEAYVCSLFISRQCELSGLLGA